MFASTSHAVRAETERAFQMSFISMLGNVAVLIGGISSVVVLTLAIVSANTMSMAIRERVKEISILKALGFSVKELSIYILAESFLLSLLGALVGIGGAWILYTQVQVSRFTQGLLPAFEMTHQITALGFLIACVLGLISALMPMLSVLRSSVVGGLKAVE
jgi:putative ABC transport system permease protein